METFEHKRASQVGPLQSPPITAHARTDASAHARRDETPADNSVFQDMRSSDLLHLPSGYSDDGSTNLTRWIVVEQDVCDALSTKFPDWAVLVIGSKKPWFSR